MPDREDRNIFERHFQTGVQVVMVALLLWAGRELVALGQSSAVLEERLAAQGALLNEMRQEMASMSEVYYRQTDARRDLNIIENRIDQLRKRVDDLEDR
ncbi:hypothetical protein M8009_13015 [Halomonas sp. ATCH28]|uniref:Uncharacterized protein n=1 Tax=Halomonas gemina TaxID=2945105 RepID=A0ABT0T317_9GAMM|nr:hypothetical protein [Halomonas gemina]MCL7941207.1 hypothetical protein [Halomonas gemina]